MTPNSSLKPIMTRASSNEKLIAGIIGLAQRAGEAIMDIYSHGSARTIYKEDDSPLTQADMAAHHILVDGLPILSPDVPVLSEESAAVPHTVRQSWETFWLVDPLDGTKEFIKRSGEFTVNIAWIQDSSPILGVVHAPALGVTYYAMKGVGAFKQIHGVVTRIGTSDYRKENLKIVASRTHGGEALEPFLEKIGATGCINVGSSLKFCLVAEGTAHLYPRLGPTMEWDTAAGQCVVEGAGGSVTDLQGEPLPYNKPDLHNPAFMVCGNPPFPWRQYL